MSVTTKLSISSLWVWLFFSFALLVSFQCVLFLCCQFVSFNSDSVSGRMVISNKYFLNMYLLLIFIVTLANSKSFRFTEFFLPRSSKCLKNVSSKKKRKMSLLPF
jgi:hypothetical protein